MAIAETTGQRLAACARYSDKNGAPAMNLDDTLVDQFKSVDASSVARLRWFLARYDLPDDAEFTSFADAAWEAQTLRSSGAGALVEGRSALVGDLPGTASSTK